MNKIWKNPVVYALIAAFPLAASMNTAPLRPILAKTTEVTSHAPTSLSRINKHILEVREEIIMKDSTEVLISFDRLMKSLKNGLLSEKKLNEGDIHQIIEGASFAAEFHKNGDEDNQYLINALTAAQYLIHEGGIYDKETLIAALTHQTITPEKANMKDLKDSFGEIVRGHVDDIKGSSDVKSETTLLIEQAQTAITQSDQ